MITTVAGNGTYGFSGDGGDGGGAQLSLPPGCAVDSAGNLYIADTGNMRVRKVADGVITTLAGNGTLGFSGDNGTATNAHWSNPVGVAVDSAGNVYIADTLNNRIRKVSNGVITTLAGTGTWLHRRWGRGRQVRRLEAYTFLAVHSARQCRYRRHYNYRVRKVANGVIATAGRRRGNAVWWRQRTGGMAHSCTIPTVSPSIPLVTCTSRTP